MKNEKRKLLSPLLRQAIKETLEKNEKIILFINRRGFFTFQTCRKCGNTVKCPNCATSLTYHFKDNKLICSYCGFTAGINIICPNCQSTSLAFLGSGTQRIEEEVGEIFHKAKIIRIDKDSVTKKGSHEKLFAAFTHGEANVLIGTQMVTKGLDLAEVTLVGVVSADSMLYIPDFRSSERTFQQLTQVAGRAGRHNLPGRVIIQTLNPDHYAIKYAAACDYKSFYEEEIQIRESLSYPPFASLINIIIQGKEEEKIIKISSDIKTFLEKRLTLSADCKILGPAKATIEKIRGNFRWQILLKGKNIATLQTAVKESLVKIIIPVDMRVSVDVDPVNML
ncbi:primosomal protein N' [candidate division WOR-1 bacterium RIFOXYA2_FULL_37_7]|nr:MAG: primosomal protein N' [candidate division WOR-1 bacterium RIFOXYA2_FULL_37_7]